MNDNNEKMLKKFLKLNFFYKKKYNKNNKSYNIIITIPKGRKYFSWIKDNEDNIYIFEYDTFNNIIKKPFTIKKKRTKNLYGDENGTVIFGTIFEYCKEKIYSIENIYLFKDKEIKINYKKKLFLMKDVLDNLKKNKEIMFGLPLINTKKDLILKEIKELPYEIYSIQYISFKNEYIYFEKIKKNEKRKVFLVSACKNSDIYYLKYKKKNKYVLYDTTLILSYKLSVFMNKIFRNIIENENIDLIEESDDENEFENISDNKFLKNIEKPMECIFNEKFKSWIPLSINKIKNVYKIK